MECLVIPEPLFVGFRNYKRLTGKNPVGVLDIVVFHNKAVFFGTRVEFFADAVERISGLHLIFDGRLFNVVRFGGFLGNRRITAVRTAPVYLDVFSRLPVNAGVIGNCRPYVGILGRRILSGIAVIRFIVPIAVFIKGIIR